MKKGCLFLLVLPLFMSNLWAKHHTVDLNVAYDTVNFTGYPARAITVNHQIPAPTLRFRSHHRPLAQKGRQPVLRANRPQNRSVHCN